MTDLERLDEAVALWDDILTHHPGSDLAYYMVLDAARAYRNLVANGERVEWCETHNSIELNGSTCMAWEQAYSETAEPWEVEIDCRMTSRLLVDPPKEEGT